MKKVIILIFLLTLVFAQAAYADKDNAPKKLGRGIANIATCWVEIPSQMAHTGETEGTVSAMTVGFVKGVTYTIGRCLAGAYDVVTFPLPLPAGYKSIVQPEFVIGTEDGAYKGM